MPFLCTHAQCPRVSLVQGGRRLALALSFFADGAPLSRDLLPGGGSEKAVGADTPGVVLTPDNPGGTPLIIQVREISRDLDLGGAMIVCDIWADGHRM